MHHIRSYHYLYAITPALLILNVYYIHLLLSVAHTITHMHIPIISMPIHTSLICSNAFVLLFTLVFLICCIPCWHHSVSSIFWLFFFPHAFMLFQYIFRIYYIIYITPLITYLNHMKYICDWSRPPIGYALNFNFLIGAIFKSWIFTLEITAFVDSDGALPKHITVPPRFNSIPYTTPPSPCKYSDGFKNKFLALSHLSLSFSSKISFIK